jgi:hypothetical protein
MGEQNNQQQGLDNHDQSKGGGGSGGGGHNEQHGQPVVNQGHGQEQGHEQGEEQQSQQRDNDSRNGGGQGQAEAQPPINRRQSYNVQLGPGGRLSARGGNHYFNTLIREHANGYNDTTSHTVRAMIVERIIRSVLTNGGRFVIFDQESGRWVPATERIIVERVSAAMCYLYRKRVASIRSSCNGSAALGNGSSIQPYIHAMGGFDSGLLVNNGAASEPSGAEVLRNIGFLARSEQAEYGRSIERDRGEDGDSADSTTDDNIEDNDSGEGNGGGSESAVEDRHPDDDDANMSMDAADKTG